MRKLFFILAILILAFASFLTVRHARAAEPAPPTLSTCTCSTQVISPTTGTPLSGVKFFVKVHSSSVGGQLVQPQTFNRATDSGGIARITVVQGAKVTISGEHPAFATPVTRTWPSASTCSLTTLFDVPLAGPVSGPGVSTDNAIVRWDDVTGALLQNSTVTLSDAGFITGATLSGASISTGTVAAARLGLMTGDSGAGGLSGAVPAPGAGDTAANKFLKANGTWTAISGVTNVYSVYNVVDYGADPTGAADSIAGFNAALAAAVAAKKGIIYVPPGTYKWNSTWTVGDGTSTTISTYAGISVIGAGGTRVNNISPASAVKILWNGSVNGTMMKVAGPIGGITVSNLYFEANNSAGTILQVMHAPDTQILNCTGWSYTQFGLDIDSWGVASFNVVPGPTETTNSYGDGGLVQNCSFVSINNNATGIRLGKTGTVANWTFTSCTIAMSGSTGSAAAELRDTDHCTFINCIGTAEVGIRNKPIAGAGGAPVNTDFYGGSWNGVHASTTANGIIAAAAGTISVASTTGFPAAGAIMINGGVEFVTYTSKNGTQFLSCTRGKYGTSDIAHATGVAVVAANDVVEDNTDATWAPTTGYGNFFSPFATADGGHVPFGDTRIWGVTDLKENFGGYKLMLFGGLGARIRGDFQNGTHANRTLFMSNASNQPTYVGVVPSGTGTSAAFYAYNGSDPDNAGYVAYGITPFGAFLDIGKLGTGVQQSFGFQIAGVNAFTIDTGRNLTVGAGFTLASVAFAALGTPANGTTYYCGDCKNVATDAAAAGSVATGAGTGAFVFRENGAWRIFY